MLLNCGLLEQNRLYVRLVVESCVKQEPCLSFGSDFLMRDNFAGPHQQVAPIPYPSFSFIAQAHGVEVCC